MPNAPALTAANFVVEGGTRVTSVVVDAVISTTDAEIVLHTSMAGDFSTYTLRLVSSPAVPDVPAGLRPGAGRGRLLVQDRLHNELRLRIQPRLPAPRRAAPHLGYLAKDYASFRRLMLDRMSQLMPDWTERNPADLGSPWSSCSPTR